VQAFETILNSQSFLKSFELLRRKVLNFFNNLLLKDVSYFLWLSQSVKILRVQLVTLRVHFLVGGKAISVVQDLAAISLVSSIRGRVVISMSVWANSGLDSIDLKLLQTNHWHLIWLLLNQALHICLMIRVSCTLLNSLEDWLFGSVRSKTLDIFIESLVFLYLLNLETLAQSVLQLLALICKV
jgi:hypothetical protein